MASNTSNKRISVKWVRDKAKAAYIKDTKCFICGTNTDLELHHLNSITLLLNRWAAENGYNIDTDEGILAVRDEFIEEHHAELYELVYTLCNSHHVKLHGIYGKIPLPTSVPKQQKWIQVQKDKFEGNTAHENHPTAGSFFSSFY